jgi:hypothetical protein
MDGWMDGWWVVAGLMEGWIDGWIVSGGWVGGWIDRPALVNSNGSSGSKKSAGFLTL